MVRPARLEDKHELFNAARRLAKEHYPQRRLDVERTDLLLRELLTNDKHFAYVTEGVKGALLALTSDHIWAQRKQSHLLLWYSTVPGEGVSLLQVYVNWIKSQRSIRVAGMQPDFDISPGVARLARREGFEQFGGAYLLYN